VAGISFGIYLPQVAMSFGQVMDRALECERLGFEVWRQCRFSTASAGPVSVRHGFAELGVRMKLGDVTIAGKAPALMATGGWRSATALARMTIVAGIALGCCLACDSGGTTSTAGGGQPPTASPVRNPAASSSQVPQAPASTGEGAGATTKSQYLSNLRNISDSGTVFYGDGEINGHHFRDSVVQVMDGQGESVSYDLGRKWRALDVTLQLIGGPSGSGLTVEFQVAADNRIIYTGDVTPGQSRHVRLSVVGVAHLDLTSTLRSDGTSTTASFAADWGSARLLG
jgi:hypothetical protein